MTAIRQEAIQLLQEMPEDRLRYIVQIIRGVNGPYHDNRSEKKRSLQKIRAVAEKGNGYGL